MGYVVTIEGKGGVTLFLVDRKYTKKRWWSSDVSDAMVFKKESAAKIQKDKLRFKSPSVMTLYEAKIVSEQQYEMNHSEPFSNEGYD